MKLNLAGATFGKLVVLSRARKASSRHIRWRCKCVCGNETTVYAHNLKRGHTQSCGCLHQEVFHNPTTHGHRSQQGISPTYATWFSMKQRCLNQNASNYKRYGGAGVTMCGCWKSFENFLAGMGERPEGTTLGRILDMGNYEVGNCFWQTRAEQKLAAMNKRALLKWEGNYVRR
jgi:ribosomal protein S27E